MPPMSLLLSVDEFRKRLYDAPDLKELRQNDEAAMLAIGEASNRVSQFLKRNLLAAEHKATFYPVQGEYDPMFEKLVLPMDDWPVHRVHDIATPSENARLESDLKVVPFSRRSGDEAKRYVAVGYKQIDPITISYWGGYRLSDESDAAVNTRLGLAASNATGSINWPSPSTLRFLIEYIVSGEIGNDFTVVFQYDAATPDSEATATYDSARMLTIKCRGTVTGGEAVDAINAARYNDEQLVRASISEGHRGLSFNWTSTTSQVMFVLAGGEGDADNGPITWPVMPEAISAAVSRLTIYEAQRVGAGAVGQRVVAQSIQTQDVEANFQSESSFERGIFRSLQSFRRMTSIMDDFGA